jgi:peptidase E
MNVILTSDFPSAAHPRVVDRMKAVAPQPRIAWVAPDTAGGHAHFDQAIARFAELGFDQLEYCDIDQEKDEVQLAYLYEFDIVYLSGGDPLRFRYNMLRTGLSGRLRQCASLDRLIVAASGGALLLTPNVSLYRLQSESVEEVLDTRGRFDGMSAVPYEVLPHVNRWDEGFLDKVSRYSAKVDNDIIALADGAALFPQTEHAFQYVGDVIRYRRGVREEYVHAD